MLGLNPGLLRHRHWQSGALTIRYTHWFVSWISDFNIDWVEILPLNVYKFWIWTLFINLCLQAHHGWLVILLIKIIGKALSIILCEPRGTVPLPGTEWVKEWMVVVSNKSWELRLPPWKPLMGGRGGAFPAAIRTWIMHRPIVQYILLIKCVTEYTYSYIG